MGTSINIYKLFRMREDPYAITVYAGNTDSIEILSTDENGLSSIKFIKNKFVEYFDDDGELFAAKYEDVISTGYLNKNDARKQIIKNIRSDIETLENKIKDVEKDILTSQNT